MFTVIIDWKNNQENRMTDVFIRKNLSKTVFNPFYALFFGENMKNQEKKIEKTIGGSRR